VKREGCTEYFDKTYLPKTDLMNTLKTPYFIESPLNLIDDKPVKPSQLFRTGTLLRPSAGPLTTDFFDRYLKPSGAKKVASLRFGGEAFELYQDDEEEEKA